MENMKMKESALNDWFLNLPEGRQRVLRDDKWALAEAFGKSIHDGLADELQAKTDLLALVVKEKEELREMLSRDKTAFLNQIELDLIKDSAKQETRELAESIHKLLNK